MICHGFQFELLINCRALGGRALVIVSLGIRIVDGWLISISSHTVLIVPLMFISFLIWK